MNTSESHLQDDGTVFPPVTPDPPLPPGQEEIVVPDIGTARQPQDGQEEGPNAGAPELDGEHTPAQGGQGPVTEPPD